MSNLNVHRFLAAAAGLAIVAAVVVGCSETITGKLADMASLTTSPHCSAVLACTKAEANA